MKVTQHQFGYTLEAKSLGEAWMSLVECCLKNGLPEWDENRARFALHGVRMTIERHGDHDPVISRFANQQSIEKMRELVFQKDTMEDFDITPSFRNGSKSYKKRIEEGDMYDFVVKRLTKIPESKKAVMIFPTYEDYEVVKTSPYNDYLPCIVLLQFRLHKLDQQTYQINTHFYMRSQDAYQKNISDLVIFSDITKEVAKRLAASLQCKIKLGQMDGYITDAHIYKNTYNDAFATHSTYLNEALV